MLTGWLARAVDRLALSILIRPTLDGKSRAFSTVRSRFDAPNARLFVHREPSRRAIILVHDYLGGHHAIEERAWPFRRWFAAGYDIALFTLPYHHVRGRNPPLCLTHDGLRRATQGLLALVQHLHARGNTRVAAMGMSLGGYLVAQLATIEASLDLVVPIVPLSHLRDLAGPAYHRALDEQGPLQRTPLVGGERMLVIGAKHDQIAPIEHARALASHFSAPLHTMRGGHLLQLGRADAFAKVDALLAQRMA